ncbi:MMPL family transporter [Nakamurella flavida]
MLVATLVAGLAALAGGSFRDEMTAPGSPSDRATQSLRASFPDQSRATARVVLTWPDTPAPGPRDAVVRQVTDALAAVPRIDGSSVRLDGAGRTALIDVRYDAPLADLDAAGLTDATTSVVGEAVPAGVGVAVGGELPESVQGPDGTAELIGVAVALLVLLLVLRSAWAALLPLLVAGAGLGVGLGLIMLLSAVVSLTSVSPTLASMIGLGIGIDYALFIVSRHRSALADGVMPVDAAGRAVVTAGRAVCIAGGAVLLGICGLAFSGVPGFAWMGMATGLVVLTTVLAALTLLPALLGLLGHRVTGRGRHDADVAESARARRWARRVVRRPVLVAVLATAVLLALAAPALGMRLGQNDAGSEAPSAPTRQAYDAVAQGFGPGANGPLVVVAERDRLSDADIVALTTGLAGTPGVAGVGAVQESPDGNIAVLVLTPTTGPQDAATADLVERVAASLPAGAALTGPTAAMLDLTTTLSAHLWQVVLAVLVATFLLLLVVFRSVLLAAKAVVVNLLSIGAAYGVMTLAFQTEPGAALIGLGQPVPIAAWAPVVLFAILFGLSMDYEVFLLTSIQERHEQGAGAADAVVDGLSGTARVIVSAAAIMVAVAAGFALDPGVMIKIIGVGLAVAILLDVTVVRMLLVPAAVAAMGEANWWLPRGLRWLPRSVAHGAEPGSCPPTAGRR